MSGNLFSLAGARALVTGASRGLGKAMAVALADAGADVVCASSRAGGALATTKAISSRGRKAWEVVGDVGDRTALAEMMAEVDRTGHVDILVNNAGTIRRAPAAEILSQHFGRAMIARGAGKIINVASLLSFSGGITVPAYTASKHAVAGLTKALANEWGAKGVQVNAIAPGYFRTDNTEALQNDPVRSEQIGVRIPANRWGEPSDMAGAVVFLASRASDYVNGHVLVVDGGWMAR